MTKRWLLALAVSSVTLAAPAVQNAQAAGHEFCEQYARSAENQVRGAINHPRCRGFIERNPGRWSDDWKVHYRWCRDVSGQAAENEREIRHRELARCAS